MRMKNLGVMAEANIMSNKATEAVTEIHDHPLLELLYRDVPTLLSTDAGGVMNTSMQMDTNAAAKIIEAYKLGQTQMLVEGRVVTYESLPSNIQRRYTVEYLNKAARQYLQEIQTAGSYPSGHATPVPGALDDER
jgi:adenosine deaminase